MNRSEIYTVNLDPTIGTEIKKTRPCVIVSPDEMNAHLLTEGKEYTFKGEDSICFGIRIKS